MNKGILPISHCPTQERENAKPAPPIRVRLLAEWDGLAAQLREPDLELTPEEFAPIMSAFCRLKRAGHEHDPVLSSLLVLLSRQAMLTYDGTEDACEIGGAA